VILLVAFTGDRDRLRGHLGLDLHIIFFAASIGWSCTQLQHLRGVLVADGAELELGIDRLLLSSSGGGGRPFGHFCCCTAIMARIFATQTKKFFFKKKFGVGL